LLGIEGKIILPAFERVTPYLSPDGQVQIDSLAENHERWAVEIKWRGRLTGKKEIERLETNARNLLAKPWFISKSGFTTEAIEYARQRGIMFSDQANLEILARLMKRLL
jgi:hypothetical protein